MTKRKSEQKEDGGSTAAADARLGSAASLLEPFTLRDVVDVSCFSRDAAAKLPDEDRLRKHCNNERELALLIEGSRILRTLALSDDDAQLDIDEVQILFWRFVQVETMLGVGTTVAKSCIGEAQAEKKKCKEDCKNSPKKFCGCFWNSFLAKADCFINIGVGG